MLCPNCSHENPVSSKFCLNCGAALEFSNLPSDSNPFGMATLRIVCRPYKALWYRIMYCTMPWTWKYKFYIDVDGKEYTMVSTEKVKEIRVPAGQHHLRIGYMMKNSTGKVLSTAGRIVEFGAIATGSANAAFVGYALANSDVDITDYFTANLEAGKTYEFKLKSNNLHIVTEDK